MRGEGLVSFGQTLAKNVDSAKIHGAVAQKPQLHTFLELHLRLNAMGSSTQLGSSPVGVHLSPFRSESDRLYHRRRKQDRPLLGERPDVRFVSLTARSVKETRSYSHFFQRKNRYGPIAAQIISIIA